MPAVLPNTTTTDNYPTTGGAQVGAQDIFQSGFFIVANNPVFGRYLHGQRGQQDESPDIYMPPGTYPLQSGDRDPLGGIRFKSAVVGSPAQVFGVLFYPGEAQLISSAEFNASIAPGGGVSTITLAPIQLVAIANAIDIESRLLAADAQPAWRIVGDGHIQWGPGGATVLDTNLYRSAAGILKTDGQFQSVGGILAAQGTALQIALGFDVLGGGQPQIYFGNALDTNLYRSGGGVVATDGRLRTSDASVGFHYFPLAATGYAFYSQISGENQPRWRMNHSGIMEWGIGGATAPDTTFYRSAANTLKTDGALVVGFASGGALAIQIPSTNVPGMTLGGDTVLYRSAAGVLKTDGSLQVASMTLPGASAGGWVCIGNTGGAPGTPTGGGILYANAGALVWKGSAGTLTVIASA